MNCWMVNYEAAWEAAVGHKRANRWPSELCPLFFFLYKSEFHRQGVAGRRWHRHGYGSFLSPFFALANFNHVNCDVVMVNTNAAIRRSVVIVIGYLTAASLESVVAAVFVELRWRSLLFFRRLICISSKCLQATKWGGRSCRSLKHLATPPPLHPLLPPPSRPPPPFWTISLLCFFFHPPLLPLIPLPALFSHSTVKAHP